MRAKKTNLWVFDESPYKSHKPALAFFAILQSLKVRDRIQYEIFCSNYKHMPHFKRRKIVLRQEEKPYEK